MNEDTKRPDEMNLFLRISDEVPVRWLVGTNWTYHASADGTRGICTTTPIVAPLVGAQTTDRSNDKMTCEDCQDLVKKVPSDECPGCAGSGNVCCAGTGRVRKQPLRRAT